MKIVDLTNCSKHKVNAEINKHCGGTSMETFWLMRFQKGLGGFTFMDPLSNNEDEKFMVSLAIFNQGIGVYCRNMYKNYLILIPENNITKLEVQKHKDIISPFGFSLFKMLKKIGISDYTASKYLMPKEIVIENKAQFTIRTPEKYLSLDIDKVSPEKVISLLKKTKFISLTEINIESPQIKTTL
ncbi:MAG TPA: hypothetical protein PKD51_15220 [Saprospiraceae bacterium]|nr:hypothetical protein [Saprospiraceae bacterium]